ncbi:cyclic GMP-AMP synthase DncV-like nucleotidyltransferase [Brevundimonas naejangsanensis]|uniref:cyclic GMP-AMP synthase DncV-like nucleotidyltransferase n=1 Tax=Brevundimonas naejangsanensis TaxID=588932 RepID=UPI0013C4BD01|nr:hypothetical protein [Brevundimonas naejangsanensis]
MVTIASTSSKRFIEALVDELDISEGRYEQANDSYLSLGRWLNRPASTIGAYGPAVYIQGSFGLGTVIKPLSLEEEYDVDAVCEFKAIAKHTVSQKSLKILLGTEIEAYRKAQNMVKPLGEGRRRRCRVGRLYGPAPLAVLRQFGPEVF